MSKRLETCPRCNGNGYFVAGKGHYGDQTGDAGAEKWVWNPCTLCDGLGRIMREQDKDGSKKKKP